MQLRAGGFLPSHILTACTVSGSADNIEMVAWPLEFCGITPTVKKKGLAIKCNGNSAIAHQYPSTFAFI